MIPQAVIDEIAEIVYYIEMPWLYKNWNDRLPEIKRQLEHLSEIYGNDVYPIFYEACLFHLTKLSFNICHYKGNVKIKKLFEYNRKMQDIYE